MATALEPGAEPEEITERELDSLGLNRIAYSIAISLKRLADATEELTVIQSAPQPERRIDAATKNAKFDEIGDMRAFAHTIDYGVSTKTTSPEMAALAAKYMGMDNDAMDGIYNLPPDTIAKFYADVRSLAACVLSQAEPKS